MSGKKKLIAVDYDDTITQKRPFGVEAPLDYKAKKYLLKLYVKGYDLVLWSSRNREDYNKAYDRCINEFKLPIERDNKKLYNRGITGKIIADFYIDDRAYPGRKINWKKVYKYIVKNIK